MLEYRSFVEMSNEAYKNYLQQLGAELQKKNITGEILISGNIIAIFEISKPEIRKDINAFLQGDATAIAIPRELTAYIRGAGSAMHEAIASIAQREGLSPDWLTGAVRDLFCGSSSKERWLEYPGLRVYLAVPQHVLAMKVATANSTQDYADIKMLAEELCITSADDILTCIKKYIPEELLEIEVYQMIKQIFVV